MKAPSCIGPNNCFEAANFLAQKGRERLTCSRRRSLSIASYLRRAPTTALPPPPPPRSCAPCRLPLLVFPVQIQAAFLLLGSSSRVRRSTGAAAATRSGSRPPQFQLRCRRRHQGNGQLEIEEDGHVLIRTPCPPPSCRYWGGPLPCRGGSLYTKASPWAPPPTFLCLRCIWTQQGISISSQLS